VNEKMRLIFLSWEYPPRVVGQLSGYVSSLSTQLANHKVEVNVVTYDESTIGLTTEPSGVKTFRVTNPVKTHIGVLTWVLTLNQEVEREAANVYYESNKHVDFVDVFDWHFIPAAVTIKNALGIPFVYSVESLEDHRSPNASSSYNLAIKSIEWLGFYEAKKVAVKSEWMKDEVIRLYNVPPDKISVISPESETWINDIMKFYYTIGDAKKNGA
jgi:glycosyltransferase involved in cell wall biosynthesis